MSATKPEMKGREKRRAELDSEVMTKIAFWGMLVAKCMLFISAVPEYASDASLVSMPCPRQRP